MNSNLPDNLMKFSSQRPLLPAIFVCISMLFFGRQATAVVIDPFDGPMQLLTTDSITPEAGNSLVDNSILGGEREIVMRQFGPGGSESRVLVNELGVSGALDFSLDVETTGSATITWDGTNSMNTFDRRGLGGIDLTEGGLHDALSATVLFDDLPMTLSFVVYAGSGENESIGDATINLPGGIGVGSAQEFVIPFSDFTVLQGTEIDFTDIGAITLTIDQSTPATDFQLGLVKTVPEPSTISLAFFGAFALLLGIWRHRLRSARPL